MDISISRLTEIEKNIAVSRVRKMGRHEAYQVAQARALSTVATGAEKREMVAEGLAAWGCVRGGIEIFYPNRDAIRERIEAG